MQYSVFTWRHQNSKYLGIVDYSECYFCEALQQLNTLFTAVESMSEKMCTRQFWKVILDMINTLFLAV